jgi:hypothetical protein
MSDPRAHLAELTAGGMDRRRFLAWTGALAGTAIYSQVRGDLAAATGLSRQTVNGIVNDLLHDGLVSECIERSTARPGPKAKLVSFRADHGHVGSEDRLVAIDQHLGQGVGRRDPCAEPWCARTRHGHDLGLVGIAAQPFDERAVGGDGREGAAGEAVVMVRSRGRGRGRGRAPCP